MAFVTIQNASVHLDIKVVHASCNSHAQINAVVMGVVLWLSASVMQHIQVMTAVGQHRATIFVQAGVNVSMMRARPHSISVFSFISAALRVSISPVSFNRFHTSGREKESDMG